MTPWSGDTRKNLEQLLVDLLELDGEIDWSLVRYQQSPQWDSLVHMAIISELEGSLSITLSPEEIVQMYSIDDILSILLGKGVVVE